MTFGQKSPKVNSRLVYYSQLYIIDLFLDQNFLSAALLVPVHIVWAIDPSERSLILVYVAEPHQPLATFVLLLLQGRRKVEKCRGQVAVHCPTAFSQNVLPL